MFQVWSHELLDTGAVPSDEVECCDANSRNRIIYPRYVFCFHPTKIEELDLKGSLEPLLDARQVNLSLSLSSMKTKYLTSLLVNVHSLLVLLALGHV
jgi:hypothetical protein